MSQTAIIPRAATLGRSRVTPDALPSLINVPRIDVVETKRRMDCRQPAYPSARRRSATTRRPRRRLRRHVRLAACAVLGITPIAFAAGSGWASRAVSQAAAPISSRAAKCDTPDRICLADSRPDDDFIASRAAANFDGRPATLNSIDSSSASNTAEATDPVIFPGYLLPDNCRGEPVNEGS
jgi:hypothetical protein